MKGLFGLYQRVHLVGIGGAGMEGLARFLGQLGCRVSGSDQAASPVLEELAQEGFAVYQGHRAAGVKDTDLVVYSAAVPADNCERQAALRAGIPQVGRAEVVGELSRSYFTIAVAGSHGKTTTSAMIGRILTCAGLEPGCLIGGRTAGQVLAGCGGGRYLVVEADEYMRGFHYLHPRAALVTSVDPEHLDCYGDQAGVEEAFLRFIGQVPFYGTTLMGVDNDGVERIRPQVQGACCTYGVDVPAEFAAGQIETQAWGSRFELSCRGESLGPVEVGVPGRHNIANALGAAALTRSLGVDLGAIRRGLQTFAGVERRYQRKGEVDGVLVVDDYAHHPAEIEATLATARQAQRRVVAVFQPHLYSRTQALCDQFARALQGADQVFVAGVYAAREEPHQGSQGDAIVAALRQQGYSAVSYVPHLADMTGQVLEACGGGEVVLTIGAGNIGQIADGLIGALKARRVGKR